ncbi:hypothetical protein [Reticulibacter mediterranei]|uniref:hypothetical protein n=1 Tax=Reticulibacter mediterranei TaxID=2778369 RepID=UPI001C687EBA|nr:hypothetical protein [Reticulibacter mediterranei]
MAGAMACPRLPPPSRVEAPGRGQAIAPAIRGNTSEDVLDAPTMKLDYNIHL